MGKNIEEQYLKLLKDILKNGVEKKDRTGTGTLSVFGRQIRHDMKLGFPLLTTKKMYFKGIVTELLWFLRGDTNIKFLVDNDCHIWDGDAYKAYVKTSKPTLDGKYLSQPEFIHWIKTNDEFAKKWGELGPVYGKQWRQWDNDKYGLNSIGNEVQREINPSLWRVPTTYLKHEQSIDQIANSIHLLKTDPDSRRNRVSSWNVGELDQMTLPPCHTDFQFFTRVLSQIERLDLLPKYDMDAVNGIRFSNYMDVASSADIDSLLDKSNVPTRAVSLMWSQRSVDTFLGLPFNIASYALLLEIIAGMVDMVPDELIGNLGDTHLYLNHIEQAKEQLTRELYPLPTLKIEGYPEEYFNPNDERLFDEFDIPDFVIENYQSHPTIKAPLSN